MGGGLKQKVSLSQRNIDIQMEESSDDDEEEHAAGACCDAYSSFMPMFESIARAADSNPRAKEKAAEMLKNVRDVVFGIAQEALGGHNSKVASNNNTGMASSNVPGMERSTESNRKRPYLEKYGSNSTRTKKKR
jgi:predicted RNase H-like nuclease (RuvC/YqgF family)